MLPSRQPYLNYGTCERSTPQKWRQKCAKATAKPANGMSRGRNNDRMKGVAVNLHELGKRVSPESIQPTLEDKHTPKNMPSKTCARKHYTRWPEILPVDVEFYPKQEKKSLPNYVFVPFHPSHMRVFIIEKLSIRKP